MATEQNKDQNISREDELFNEKLNTEFPLSGGETEEDWEKATGDLFDGGEDSDENKEDKTEFKRRLNKEFPLSGGETEEAA